MLQYALKRSDVHDPNHLFQIEDVLLASLSDLESGKVPNGYLSTSQKSQSERTKEKSEQIRSTMTNINLWGSHGGLAVNVNDVPLPIVIEELALLRDISRLAKNDIADGRMDSSAVMCFAKLSPSLLVEKEVTYNGDVFDDLLELLTSVLLLHRESAPELPSMICETLVHLCAVSTVSSDLENELALLADLDPTANDVNVKIGSIRKKFQHPLSTAAKLLSFIADPKKRNRLSETGRISIAAAATSLGAGYLLIPALYPPGCASLPEDLLEAIQGISNGLNDIAWGSIAWLLAEMLATSMKMRSLFSTPDDVAVAAGGDSEEPDSPLASRPTTSKASLDLSGIFCITPSNTPATTKPVPPPLAVFNPSTPTNPVAAEPLPFSDLLVPMTLIAQLFEATFQHSYHFSANIPTTFQDGGDDLRLCGSWVSHVLHRTLFQLFQNLPPQLWVTIPPFGVIGALEGLCNALGSSLDDDSHEQPQLPHGAAEVLYQLMASLSSGRDWYSHEGSIRLAGICFCASSLLAGSSNPHISLRELRGVRVAIELAGVESDTPYHDVEASQGCSILGAVAVSMARVASTSSRGSWSDPSESEVSLQRGCLSLINSLLHLRESGLSHDDIDALCGTSLTTFTTHFVAAVLSSDHKVSQWSYSWCLQTGACKLISKYLHLFDNISHIVGLLLTSKLYREALSSPGVAFCATKYVQLALDLCTRFPEVPRTYGTDVLTALTTFTGGMSKLADPEFSDFCSAWLSFVHQLLDLQQFNILQGLPSQEVRDTIIDQLAVAVSYIYSNALRSLQLVTLSGDTTIGFGCTRVALTALHECAVVLSTVVSRNPTFIARMTVPCSFSVMHTSNISMFFMLLSSVFELEDSNLVEMVASVVLDILYHNPNGIFQSVKATVSLETRVALQFMIHDRLSEVVGSSSEEQSTLCRVTLCRSMFNFDSQLFYGLVQANTTTTAAEDENPALPEDWMVRDLKTLVNNSASGVSMNRGIAAESLGLLSDLGIVSELTEATAPHETINEEFKALHSDPLWPLEKPFEFYSLTLREVMWQTECGLLLAKAHATQLANSADTPPPITSKSPASPKEMKPLNLNDNQPDFTVQQSTVMDALLLYGESLLSTLETQLKLLALSVTNHYHGMDAQTHYNAHHSYIGDGSITDQHPLGNRSHREATHHNEQVNISLILQGQRHSHNNHSTPQSHHTTVPNTSGSMTCYDANRSHTSLVGSGDSTIRRKHHLNVLFDRRNKIGNALILTPDSYELDEEAALCYNRCPIIYSSRYAVIGTNEDALYNLCLSTVDALSRIVRSLEGLWLTLPLSATSCSAQAEVLIVRSVRLCVAIAAACQSPSRLTHRPLEMLFVRCCDTVLSVHASGVAKMLEDFQETDPDISRDISTMLQILQHHHTYQYVAWTKALLAASACKKYTMQIDRAPAPSQGRVTTMSQRVLGLLSDMLMWPEGALSEMDVIIYATKVVLATYGGDTQSGSGTALSKLFATVWFGWYKAVMSMDPNAPAISHTTTQAAVGTTLGVTDQVRSDESMFIIGTHIITFLLKRRPSLAYELNQKVFLNLFKSLANDFSESTVEEGQWTQRSSSSTTQKPLDKQPRIWHQVWTSVLAMSQLLVVRAPDIWASPVLQQLNSSTRVQQQWLPNSTTQKNTGLLHFRIHEVNELSLVSTLYHHAVRFDHDHDSKRLAAQWAQYVLLWVRDTRSYFRLHSSIDSVDILGKLLDILFAVPFRTPGHTSASTTHVSLSIRNGGLTFDVLLTLIRVYMSYLVKNQNKRDADMERLGTSVASGRTSPRKQPAGGRSPSPVLSHISDDIAESEFRGDVLSDARLRVTGEVCQRLILFYLGNWMALYKSEEVISVPQVQQLQEARGSLCQVIYRFAEGFLVDGVIKTSLEPSLQKVLTVMEKVVPILESFAP